MDKDKRKSIKLILIKNLVRDQLNKILFDLTFVSKLEKDEDGILSIREYYIDKNNKKNYSIRFDPTRYKDDIIFLIEKLKKNLNLEFTKNRWYVTIDSITKSDVELCFAISKCYFTFLKKEKEKGNGTY